MKQLLQNLRNGETQVAEVPVPTPQNGQVLVQTAASLVSSGTERMLVEFAEKSLLAKAKSRPDLVRQVVDKARREGILTTLEAAFNRLDQPLPLGYSSAGTIVALAQDVSGFQVGQRVACAGGGYAVHAEYAVVPRNLLAVLPDNVDFESAAFTTLGAIALHGFRLAEVQVGARVAVIGLGLLGLLCAGIARAAGCQVLGIDLDPSRVQLACQVGAEAVVRPEAEQAWQGFSRGRGCDAVLICADTSSSDPVELAGVIARDRARVVAMGAVGLNVPRRLYFEKEITFINSRSYGPGRYDPAYEEAGQDYPIGYVRWTEGRNLEAFVDLLATGRLDVHPLITHRIPIREAPSAYQLITGKKDEPFLGVLLIYPASGGDGNQNPLTSMVVNQVRTEIRPSGTMPHASRPESVKLGVLGAGNFPTNVLLPALRGIPGLELVGIASASGLSAEHARRRFGFGYASSDAEQVLNDPTINTIAILTPHHLHAELVRRALQAGKNVFCEKPLALNEEELQDILQVLPGYHGYLPQDEYQIGDHNSDPHLEAASSRPTFPYPHLVVGFNRRFAPLAQQLKSFLGARMEPLLAHYRVNAGFLPLTHWLHDPRQGGGRIIGEGCHFIDFLAFLVGDPPVSVTAHALPDGGRYREDNAVLTFTFADGSLGTLTYAANGDKAFPKERLEVFAGGLVAVLDDFRSLAVWKAGKRTLSRSRLRQDKGHRAEWEQFIQVLTSGDRPPIPYSHLVGVTRAAFAAVESLRSGQQVPIIHHPTASG